MATKSKKSRRELEPVLRMLSALTREERDIVMKTLWNDETQEETNERILRAYENVKEGKHLISFTPEEWSEFARKHQANVAKNGKKRKVKSDWIVEATKS